MSMKDIKSIKVAPENRDEAVMLFQSFGWDLKDSNEVKTNDSQIKTGSDENYDYFKTVPGEHYIRLGFERDREHKNYEELKSLEEQYYALKDPYCPYAPSFITLLWVILIVGGFLLYIIPGIILLVVHIVLYVINKKQWETDYEDYQQKLTSVESQREEIISKAQSLV